MINDTFPGLTINAPPPNSWTMKLPLEEKRTDKTKKRVFHMAKQIGLIVFAYFVFAKLVHFVCIWSPIFVYKQNVFLWYIKKCVRLFTYTISWTDCFFVYTKVGPTFCYNKMSDRLFYIIRCRADYFFYIKLVWKQLHQQ